MFLYFTENPDYWQLRGSNFPETKYFPLNLLQQEKISNFI